MLLNQTAEYALRAMAVLASRWPDGRVTSAELAEGANIPGHYISKVMRRLVLAHLVDAQRGHGGGFRLSRAPGRISFMQVLDAVDFQAEEQRCAFGFGRCNPNNPCSLHPAYSALNECFGAWARATTMEAATPDAIVPRVRAMTRH